MQPITDRLSRRAVLPVLAAALVPRAASAQTPDAEPEAVHLLRQFVERVSINGDLTAIAELVDPNVPPQNPSDIAGATALAQRWRSAIRDRIGTYQERITGAYGCDAVAVVVTQWRETIGDTLWEAGSTLYACEARDGLIRRLWAYRDIWDE